MKLLKPIITKTLKLPNSKIELIRWVVKYISVAMADISHYSGIERFLQNINCQESYMQ